MKKLLLFAVVALMSLAANAQQLKLDKSKKSNTAMRKAPAKAAGIDGTDLWGYYLGDGSDFGGLGTGDAGSFRVAIKVPGDGVLKGAKIRGLNIPALGAITNSSAWVSTGLTNASRIATKSFTASSAGYYVVEFDEPIEIPASGLYAGYTFTSQEGYPIATAGEDTPGGLFLATSATGSLEDYSTGGFGVSGLQVFVEGMTLPENAVTLSKVSSEAVVKGATCTGIANFTSDGSKGVQIIGYDLTINGIQTSGTVILSPEVPGGLAKSGSFQFSFTAPDEVGSFPASIAVTSVNGKPNELSTEPVSFTVNTVSRVVPRMTVIEEATGTGCGWCTRGWVAMEYVKEHMSDKALVIAAHWYNSSDPMYVSNYDTNTLPKSSAPLCVIDRKQDDYLDPYYADLNDANSLKEAIVPYVENINKSLPTVDVKVSGSFTDETNTKVSVKANTEFLTNTKGYKLAFVLTADELTGTTTSWKQSNYYYQYSSAQVPADLADFAKNGKYGKSSVQLVFNDVMIGSSWTASGVLQTPAYTKGNAGDIETIEYTLTMPTKAALVKALNYEKIYITALVIDDKGQIANAARVRVLGAGEQGSDDGDNPVISIDGAKVSDMTDEVQLMGENMSPNAKYVVGMNFATYAPAAWNVETNEYIEFPDYEEGAFHAANSNGIFVGDDGNYAIKADAAGNVTPLYRNVGEEIETDWGPMSTGDAGSSAYAISEDGKVIAGFYYDAAYNTTPCIWTENNVRIDLPLPTMEEAGFEVNGGQVRYMSADGKVLVGFLIDNFSTWPACIWRQNESGGYDYDIICKDYWEEGYQQGKPYMVFNPASVSANGEWISLTIQNEFDDWDFTAPQPPLQAARFNLTNKTLEILNDDTGLAPTGIANNGTTLVYAGGNDMMGRAGYVWEADKTEVISLDDVLSKIPELEELASNTPCAITADGKYVQGFGINGENIFSYVVDYNKATVINTAKVDNKTAASDRIFNINGQQVRNMNGRGIYIVRGKKVLVK